MDSMLDEIRFEAARCDRSLSWLVQGGRGSASACRCPSFLVYVRTPSPDAARAGALFCESGPDGPTMLGRLTETRAVGSDMVELVSSRWRWERDEVVYCRLVFASGFGITLCRLWKRVVETGPRNGMRAQ